MVPGWTGSLNVAETSLRVQRRSYGGPCRQVTVAVSVGGGTCSRVPELEDDVHPVIRGV